MSGRTNTELAGPTQKLGIGLLALWIFGGTLVALAMVVGLAIYGLRTALAGRPLFPDEFAAPAPGGARR